MIADRGASGMADRWIAVVGQGRGGTSPLYYAIVAALRERGERVLATYEKYQPEVFSAFQQHARERWVVAKFLTNHRAWSMDLLQAFPHRIQIVRDPRDSAVSSMLFSAVHMARRSDAGRLLDAWLRVVRQKEENPTRIDFLSVYRAALEALGRHAERLEARRWTAPIRVHRSIDPITVRLEDLIAGDPALSTALGLHLEFQAPPSGKEHVMRAGESTWRHWFTPADIDYFRPRMLPFMERFGYQDEWELAPNPRIDPAQSSQYAVASFDRIRERLDDLADPERKYKVYGIRAAHGDVRSAYLLAVYLVDEGKRLEEARELAVFAASGGVRRAQVLAARLFTFGIGGERDDDEAGYWHRAADAPTP